MTNRDIFQTHDLYDRFTSLCLRSFSASCEMISSMIVFLSARNEDYTLVTGFDAGADDYIIKPIKPRVFLSRIKALLRRRETGILEEENIAVSSGLYIDREKYLITKNGESIFLRRREFELLSLLASKPGKVFTRDEILLKVWGNRVVVNWNPVR